MLTTSAARKAPVKPDTVTPRGNMVASQNTMPLTTSVKSPSVKMFSGRVSKSRIGFSRALRTPRTRANISVEPKFPTSSWPAGSNLAATHTEMAVMIRRNTVPSALISRN